MTPGAGSPSGPSRLWGWLVATRRWWCDVALAAALAALATTDVTTLHRILPAFEQAQPGSFGDAPPVFWVDLALALVATLSLCVRRLAPLPVLVVVAGSNVAHGLHGGVVTSSELLALFVALYTVAALCGRRVLALGAAIALLAQIPLLGPLDRIYYIHWPLPSVGLAIAVALGEVRRRLDRHTLGLELRNRELEIERRANARRGAAAERARIARELHDLVAHGVSLMVLNAGAARLARDKDPARAASALSSIEAAGRQAMEELQRLFDVLGGNGAEPDRTRQPAVSEIASLAEGFRGAGLEVDAQVEEALDHLPQGLSLSVYRIAQEGLTNALKHSQAGRARLRVAREGPEVVVEVADPGPSRRPATATGGGHGHIGMRERVTLYGGRLSAGPVGDAGHRVEARFPLDQGARL